MNYIACRWWVSLICRYAGVVKLVPLYLGEEMESSLRALPGLVRVAPYEENYNAADAVPSMTGVTEASPRRQHSSTVVDGNGQDSTRHRRKNRSRLKSYPDELALCRRVFPWLHAVSGAGPGRGDGFFIAKFEVL